MAAFRSLSCLLVCLAAGAGTAHAAPPLQSDESFRAAVGNQSSAPSYVLITVIDARSAAVRTGCTTANFLRGALHREHEIDFNAAGEFQVEQLALSSETHTYTFSRNEAIDNVRFHYTDSDLASVRESLQNFSTPQLREGFSAFGKLHGIYRVDPYERHEAYRDATACVLIERGLSPAMGDVSDQLRLTP